MIRITSAVQRAAETLQRISETTAGERRSRAATVALVLRAVEARAGGAGSVFLERRAAGEVEGIASPEERAMLVRLLLSHADPEAPEELTDLLVRYAAELERTRRVSEADAVMELARGLAPRSAEIALLAGRMARMEGDRERAMSLYSEARLLDAAGSIGRLAAVGEAVVSDGAERALSRVVRSSVRAGDHEAAGVALEERARVRRREGRRLAAARDLCTAAARYPDAVDRARVAHELADLCIAADDPAGAREALLVALNVGDASQREHATSRLHALSRDLGDRVGMRRWRSFERPSLVSLSPRPMGVDGLRLAPMLIRWRRRVGVSVG